jgi:ABC-type bacteriocin/lantibiotic exporter with double-glycine peptidase domain
MPMHLQSALGLCGIAVMRSVLEAQFGIRTTENELIEIVAEFYPQKKGLNSSSKETIQKLGTSPAAMAYCLKKKIKVPINIFCSKKGEINELQTLLQEKNIVPILHRSVRPPEFGLTKPEGHYVIFCGIEKDKVKIFDPKVGLREYAINEFDTVWKNNDEKWFLVIVPEGIELNVKGRYL